MKNSLEWPITLARFYQQQQQQEQLLKQQQQQQQQQWQLMHPLQKYYINENQNCDDEDLDEINRMENLFINEKRQFFGTIKLSRLITKLKVH